MSLGGSLDADLGDPDTDKANQNKITRCQSMMVNEDQHWGNWTKMADVEAMYYQVQVPEYQQSFLKFLWWENHDIEKEPQDCHVYTCMWWDIISQLLELCLMQDSCRK